MECKNGKNFNRTRIQAEGNFVCPKKHWTLLYYLNSLFYLYFSPDQNLTSERDRATTPTENVLEMNFFFSLIKTWLNKSRARINFFFFSSSWCCAAREFRFPTLSSPSSRLYDNSIYDQMNTIERLSQQHTTQPTNPTMTENGSWLFTSFHLSSNKLLLFFSGSGYLAQPENREKKEKKRARWERSSFNKKLLFSPSPPRYFVAPRWN